MILENFESEIKEAFRYQEGLKVPIMGYEGKIIYSETTQEANFAYDNQGYVLDKTAFFIVDKSNSQDIVLYLNAILTSKVILWYIRQTTATLGSKGFNMGKQYIEKIPIPKINEKNQSTINKIIDTINSRIKKDATSTTLELDSQIDELVYSLYHLSDEEIAFIHSL